jgi:hypothetical protein
VTPAGTEMKMIVVALVVIVVIVGVLFARSRIAPELNVKVADVPAIFQKLKATGKDSSFAVFAFVPPGYASDRDAINIQFSIDEGKIGVDWVLLGQPNNRDQEKFTRFAKDLGYTVSQREMNNVRFLRVENGDLPTLCQGTISDLYAVPQGIDLLLIPGGFTWP